MKDRELQESEVLGG